MPQPHSEIAQQSGALLGNISPAYQMPSAVPDDQGQTHSKKLVLWPSIGEENNQTDCRATELTVDLSGSSITTGSFEDDLRLSMWWKELEEDPSS